jgi:hypothetical protein
LHSSFALNEKVGASENFINTEIWMNKPIAILAFFIAGQLSVAHATTDDATQTQVEEPSGVEGPKSSSTVSSLEPNDNLGSVEKRNLAESEQEYEPTQTLTNDPNQFNDMLTGVKGHRSLVHVNFDSVAGQTAPFFVAGSNDDIGVSIYGSNGALRPQAVTTVDGMPATHWFSEKADSTFVLVQSTQTSRFSDGSVKIVFPQDIYATNLRIAEASEVTSLADNLVLHPGVALIDTNGVMVGAGSVNLAANKSAFLGVISDIPFRSMLISSTADKWMLSDLNYDADDVAGQPTLNYDSEDVHGHPTRDQP